MAAAAAPVVTVAISEALTALNAILAIIASIHAQGGMTADEVLQAAQAMTAANNTLYANLIAQLKAQAAVPPPPVA